MKVALCLSGLVGYSTKSGKGNPIDYRLAYQHFKKNISDNQIELDVFMHSWSVDYKSELIECYKPKDYIFEPLRSKLIPKYKLIQQSIPIYVATPLPPLNFNQIGNTCPRNIHNDATYINSI